MKRKFTKGELADIDNKYSHWNLKKNSEWVNRELEHILTPERKQRIIDYGLFSDNKAEMMWLIEKIGGFDKNYKGNAILEDCDFCFNAKNYDGKVLFSPKPVLEHLRARTGGTRQSNSAKGMFYRSHNTVYFFRKYGRHRFLLFVLIYLNGVAFKDWVQKKHGISAFIWTWCGFYKGFITKLIK